MITTNRIIDFLPVASPAIVQTATKKEEQTIESVKEACQDKFVLITDPPLSIIGQCFSEGAIQVTAVDNDKRELALTFPKGISQKTKDKIEEILQRDVIPGYKVRIETGDKSLDDFGIKVVVKKPGKKKLSEDADEGSEEAQELDALRQPIIRIHHPKLIELFLTPEEINARSGF